MTCPDGDIVHAFLRCLAQWAPAGEVERAERELRAAHGGRTYYICKPPGWATRADRDSVKCRPKK